MADDKKFTEDAYEQTLIALFRDELGYAYECGYEVERDYKEPCLLYTSPSPRDS